MDHGRKNNNFPKCSMEILYILNIQQHDTKKYYFPNYIWPMTTYIAEQPKILASFFLFAKNVSVISSINCLNCNVTRCKTFDK